MKFLTLVLLGLTLTLSASVASAVTSSSVTLTWSAVGDDSMAGTATQYDLRYSTAVITAANFSAATRWTSTPVPLAPSTQQSSTVTGLSANTLYYFAIKTGDDAGNWSLISNVTSKATLPAPDVTRPAPIAVNLTAITDSTVTMNWTAVGDDSLSGTAQSYDIRYSTSPITTANWTAATQATVGVPIPALAGTAQSYKVAGLSRQVTYYFAIRATDDVGNVSAISNVPSATTTDTMAPGVITTLAAS